MRAITLVVVAVVGAPSIASADTRTSLTGTVGLFTPVGELGAELTIQPLPSLEIAVGGGIAFSGPQVAVMPRLRGGDQNDAVTLGLGLSAGNYQQVDICFGGDEDSCQDGHATVVWANAEGAYEMFTPSGGMFRLFLGMGRVIDARSCSNWCGNFEGDMLGYFGVSIGHTL